MPTNHSSVAHIPDISTAIQIIRGHKVLMDFDLAALYGIPVKVLLQSVHRNLSRFPPDFLLRLTREEWSSLRSQIVTLEARGKGRYRKYLPFAFTEQGVAMLSSVLRSDRAVAVNIEIMRTFVRMRVALASNDELRVTLVELGRKVQTHDDMLTWVHRVIRQLTGAAQPPHQPPGSAPELQ